MDLANSKRTHPASRVTVLEFYPEPATSPPDSRAPMRIIDIKSPDDLNEYLEPGTEICGVNGPDWPSRLILAEGLDPSYVNLLSEHFSIDCALFTGHLPVEDLSTVIESGRDASTLLSPPQANFWALQFYEILAFRNLKVFGEHAKSFQDANVGTKIHFAKAADNSALYGIALSNAKFWSKLRIEPSKGLSNSPVGWDAIILLDPPAAMSLPPRAQPDFCRWFKHILTPYNIEPDWKFPPSASPFDIILFLCTTRAGGDIGKAIMDPSGRHAAIFLGTLITWNWALLAEVLNQHILHLENELELITYSNLAAAAPNDIDLEMATSNPVEILEQTLAEIYMWRRRFTVFLEQVQRNCRTLGIDLRRKNAEANDEQATERGFERDLTSVVEHLASGIRRCSALLTFSVVLLQAQRSQSATKGIIRMSTVGLFFIPLSLVATMFSMSDPFGPLGERFWVFFAVGFPMIAGVYLISLGINKTFSGLSNLWRDTVRFVKKVGAKKAIYTKATQSTAPSCIGAVPGRSASTIEPPFQEAISRETTVKAANLDCLTMFSQLFYVRTSADESQCKFMCTSLT